MSQAASNAAIALAEQVQYLCRALENAEEDLRRTLRERDSARQLVDQLKADLQKHRTKQEHNGT
jgi:hypothetical protein